MNDDVRRAAALFHNLSPDQAVEQAAGLLRRQATHRYFRQLEWRATGLEFLDAESLRKVWALAGIPGSAPCDKGQILADMQRYIKDRQASRRRHRPPRPRRVKPKKPSFLTRAQLLAMEKAIKDRRAAG
jgi:hypothetical protein